MSSTTAPPQTVDLPEVPPMLGAADRLRLLSEVRDLARVRERALVDLVARLGELMDAGGVEDLEGLPVDLVLALDLHLTGSDRGILLEAARLRDRLPVTFGWWAQGVLSWSQVRAIVSRCQKLSGDDLAYIDRRIAASREDLDAADPDQLVHAVDAAVTELGPLRNKERREAAVAERNFVHFQFDFEGGASLYGQLDAASAATAANSMASAGDRMLADSDASGKFTPSQRNAIGLLSMARDELSGWDGRGRRLEAKPTVIVHVDLAQATATDAGMVELDAPGFLPTLTSRVTDALAQDADLRCVLFDGGRPLAVSDLIHAKDVPTKTSIAVKARDMGCRGPASRAPLSRTHLHHFVERARGGTHDVDNLGAFSPTWHLYRTHRRGWRATIDGNVMTWRWRHRTHRTLPRSWRLRRPRDDPDGP